MVELKLHVVAKKCFGVADYSKKPWLLTQRSSKGFIVLVVFAMSFTDMFLYGLIVPIIPSALEERLGIPNEHAQSWISLLLAVYGLGIFISSPLFGYLADHYSSRRAPLTFGLCAMLGATALLGFGDSIAFLVVGRGFQGTSCAIVWTVGLALLADTVPENELGKWLGVISLSMTGGTVLGPLASGIVYDLGGYHAVFYMAFALICFDIVLMLLMVEKKVARKYGEALNARIDHIDSTEGLVRAEGDDNEGGYRPESQPYQTEETYTEDSPLIPKVKGSRLPPIIWLLGSRRLLVALLASSVYGIMLTAFDAVVPLFVMQTFGWSATGSGLVFLTIFLPSFLAPFFGQVTDKHGPRLLATGSLLFACPFYVLLRLVTHESPGQEALLCILLLAVGLAITGLSTPIFAEIMYIVHDEERKYPDDFGNGGATGSAYGLFNLAFAVGAICGPTLAGLIKDNVGWGAMGLTLGAVCAVTSIPVFFITGGNLSQRVCVNDSLPKLQV